MKCQICQRRKAKHQRLIAWAKAELMICEKCRRAECPTSVEEKADWEAEERRTEFQAELGAGCFDLP